MTVVMIKDSASDFAVFTNDPASWTDAEALVLSVTEALRVNDMESAAKSARLLAETDAPDPRGLVLLAQHFAQTGNSGLIVAHLAPHVHKFPANGPLHEVLSRAYHSLKQRGKPAGLESAAVTNDSASPIDVEAVVLGVSQALQVSDVESAVKSARLLAEIDPPDPRGLLLLAQCFMATGRHTGLIVPHLAPYIHKFPSDASLHWLLSIGYHSLRQRGKAAEHAHIVVNLKPHWVHAQFALGHHYYESGSSAQAIPFLRKAVELSPDDFDSNHFLSICLAMGSEFEEALGFNRRALALDPHHESAQRLGDDLKELVKAPPSKMAMDAFIKAFAARN